MMMAWLGGSRLLETRLTGQRQIEYKWEEDFYLSRMVPRFWLGEKQVLEG
jgi:hypothetical protein